ncbi:MAG TPA: hypothetical protein VII72_02860 [Myxococcota bacterium]|jgi:hypothetical protein
MTARARAACALGWLLLAGCEIGPLGGTPLRGEPAAESVRDWSFLEPRYTIEIETHASSLLPSAQARFVVQDGVLWLYAMATADLEFPWVRRLRDVDAGVTILVDGRLHSARAVLVRDPDALAPLLPSVLRKYHFVETSRARFVASPERFPGTQIRHWFFRVEPAPR